MKKNTLKKYAGIAVILVLAIFIIAKLAGGEILKLYVKAGVGDCKEVPFLCMAPGEATLVMQPDKIFESELIPHKFPEVSIRTPRGFSVVQQTIKRVYYKRKKNKQFTTVIYVLGKRANFFLDLYPQVKKDGVNSDYEFINRLMSANVEKIKNLYDAFFVIMKGIFTPDLGNPQSVTMVRFSIENIKGFCNYNLEAKKHYFDFNMFDNLGNFYKVYIKDEEGLLDLNKAMTVASTAGTPDN